MITSFGLFFIGGDGGIARLAFALADTPRLKTVHRTVFFTAVSITFHSKNIRVPRGYS